MCTNFLVSVPTDSSGALMHASARCLELASDMSTSLYVVPRAQAFPLVTPPYTPPGSPNWASWTNQYGFVGIASPKAPYTFMDGLNEKGLSVGALWLPGTSFPASGSAPNVFFGDFASWILGNFASVAELQAQLGANPAPVSIVGPPSSNDPSYVPLHYIATDSTGASVVVEFVGGAMKVYGAADGTSDGVLTNAPTYDWHRTNLQNYANLDVIGPVTSVSSEGPPVGDGLTGMPGDPMSASRFVRAATMRKGYGLLASSGSGWLPAPGGTGSGFAPAAQTVVNVAMQLVQVVMATPYGTLLALPTGQSTPVVGDWTMWSVVRDHTNVKLYYTTAFNGIMRMIDLASLDFDAPARESTPPAFPSIALLPSPGLEWCVDASSTFE